MFIYIKMHSTSNDRVQSPYQDIELEKKVKKACEKTSENIHIVSNEPSLACYRLQEHIRKTLPQIVEKRLEVNQVQKQLQGKCYDLEYSISAVKSIESSQKSFKTTQELIKSAIFTKQQLTYEESQSTAREKKTPLSMYQRFSGSFDLHSSFLPNTAPISSSTSASGSFINVIPSNTKLGPSPRRARASSVSSSPSSRRGSLTAGSLGGSASAATTPKHSAGGNRSKTASHPSAKNFSQK